MRADKEFVLTDEKRFEIVDEWKGKFLFEDRLFFMKGDAEKIEVFITGKFIEKTNHGNRYDITVHIHSEKTVEFSAKGKITGIISEDKAQTTTSEPIDLLFMIKDSHHRYQVQEYTFTTKLYDKKTKSHRRIERKRWTNK